MSNDVDLESANKSAASAASLDYLKFQAVIKSSASAASPRGGHASGRLDHGFCCAILGAANRRCVRILRSLVQLPSYRPWDPLGFLETALAANLITAARSLRGGCASNRLDHGLKVKLEIGESRSEKKLCTLLRSKS